MAWFKKPNSISTESSKRLCQLRSDMKKRPPVQIHVDPEKEKKTVLNNVTFTQVGELVRLLVVGDLVYAGIFEPPTLEEMGTMIHKVNKGAIAGLTKLHVLSGQHTAQQVIDALSHVYDAVHSGLTQEEWMGMGMDVLTLEHSLCKYKRVDRIKTYK